MNKSYLFFQILAWIGVGVLTACYVMAIPTFHIVTDANYYLPIAREVLLGKTPTVDVATSYTPFIYYTYAMVFKLLGDRYINAVSLIFAVQAINVFLILFLIHTNKWIKKEVTPFVVLAIVAMMLVGEGMHVLIEPFQVFFALISVCSLFHSKKRRSYWDLLAGLAMGISIMYKQYSCLFVLGIPVWYIHLYAEKKKLLPVIFKFCLFGIGVTLPFLAFVVLTEASLIASLKAFGFLGSNAVDYAMDAPILIKVKGAFSSAVFRYPFLSLPFVIYGYVRMLKKGRKEASIWQIPDVIFCIGLFAFAATISRSYAHYYQLVLPWAVILWVFLLSNFNPLSSSRRIKLSLRIFAGLAFCALTVSLMIRLHYDFFDQSTSFKGQQHKKLQQAEKSMKIFAHGSEVLVIPGGKLYYTCGYQSPIDNYSFIAYVSLMKSPGPQQTRDVKRIILYKGFMNSLKNKTDQKRKESFLETLFSKGFKMVGESNFAYFLQRE